MKKIYIITVSVITISIAFFAYNFFTHQKTQETDAAASRTGLIGHWSMDSNDVNGTTVYDRSGNNKNGTIGGTPTTATGKIGQALDFNGSSQVLSIDDSTLYNFTATTPFTISAWVKPTATITTFSHIAGRMAGSINRYSIHIDSSSRFSSLVGGTTGGGYVISTNIPPVGQWTLLTMTYDGSSNLNGTTNYLNGVSVKVGSSSVISGELYSQDFTIGRDTTTSYPFNGLIDDVRIYDYALSAQEVSELYSSAKTNYTQTPSRTGLVGYWNMDSTEIFGTNVYDTSGKNNHGTMVGGGAGGSPTSTVGKIGQGLDFDGSNGYINTNNQTTLNPGTGSYTISAWAKTTDSGNYGTIFGSNWAGSTSVSLRKSNTNKLEFVNLISGVGGCNISVANSGITDIADGKWHHIVGVIDVDNTKCTIYLDKKIDKSLTYTPIDLTSTIDYYIGALNSVGSPVQYWNGQIDDVRIYNYALSAQEVSELYNSAKTNYIQTPSRTGLVGYWNMDSIEIFGTNVYDTSGKNNHGTWYPQSQTPTSTIGKINQAIDFDKSNGYIVVPSFSPSTPINGTATITGWFKFDQFAVTRGTAIYLTNYFYQHGANNYIYIAGTSSYFGVGPSLKTGVWYHIAYTQNGNSSNANFYVNGIKYGSNAGGQDIPAKIIFSIGSPGAVQGANNFDGSIDDVRVYNYVLSDGDVAGLYNSSKKTYIK